MRRRLKAGIEALLEQLDGTIQPGRDIRTGDVEALGRLLCVESFVHAQLDHLLVDVRKKPDHLMEQSVELSLLLQFFGGSN